MPVLCGLFSQAVTQRLGCYTVDLEFKSMQTDGRCSFNPAAHTLRNDLKVFKELINLFSRKCILFNSVK